MIRRKEALAAAFAALAVLLVYAAAPPARFLRWDDAANLLDHERWRGFSLAHLKWMWTTRHYGPWQPLSWLSWAVDHALWGLDPAGFRRTNAVLHALAAGLAALAARRALGEALPKAGERALLVGALGAALVFALHPLRVESVAWITERRDVLSGVLAMGALLAWLEERRRLSAALFALALLSKGTAVAFLPIVFAFELAVRRRRASDVLRALAPHGALAAAAAFMNLRGFAGGELRAPDISLLDRLLLAGNSAWFYLAKTLLPAGLSPYYALPLDMGAARLGLGAGAAAALGLTAIACAPRIRSWALPSWLAYLAALAPVSGLLQNGRQFAADRYSYLPALPYAFLAGAGLVRLAGRAPRAAAGALAALALILSSLTVRQTSFWANDVALWSRAVALQPDSYLPRSNLAQALLAAGRGPEAAPHYEAAIRLEPRDAHARVNLATIYEGAGRAADAERLYREAVALEPNDALARFNLGALLVGRGRRAEGVSELKRALALDPSLARLLTPPAKR